MGLQGITQDWQFAWSGGEKTVEEEIDLSGIDGEKGEAGVEFLAGRILVFRQELFLFPIGEEVITGCMARTISGTWSFPPYEVDAPALTGISRFASLVQ